MRQKYDLRDHGGRWHVVVQDWEEGAPEGNLRCTYCGKSFEMVEEEGTPRYRDENGAFADKCLEAPSEEEWCRLPTQQPYTGTKLHSCVFYGALKDMFWIGRPPHGEPVVVANIEGVTFIPVPRFERFMEYVINATDRLVDVWHEDDENEHGVSSLQEFLGMSEEEYNAYMESGAYPGDIIDLRRGVDNGKEEGRIASTAVRKTVSEGGEAEEDSPEG